MKEGVKNIIIEKTILFALEIIQYSELLERNKKFVIARQLLRSATGIGANVWEAQSAESRSDFIHKMKIAAKEAEETAYWIELCRLSPGYPETGDLSQKCFEIKKIIASIIISAKRI